MASRLDQLEQVEVTNRAAWRAWLKKHHTRTEGIWLITFKVHVAGKYVDYAATVEEALCFGWIDSLPRKLDADRKMLYFCPRKPKSVWSKVNKDRIVELIAAKRMTVAGQKKIDDAKKNGSWESLDHVEALTMPDELIKALTKNKAAQKHFDAFPPSSRKMILLWITSAKTEATRTKRIGETVTLAAKNIRANHYAK
jgi:uncharacterized protein YdeI (YjbR/CyaY-like superfamily)